MTGNWRARLRSIIALVTAIVVGVRLDASGWPWWAWLPVTVLSAMFVYMACVLSWFLYRKLTYRRFAAIARRRHRARVES